VGAAIITRSVVDGLGWLAGRGGISTSLPVMLFVSAWKHVMRADGGVLDMEMVSHSCAASADGKASYAHCSGTCFKLILAVPVPGRYISVVPFLCFLSISAYVPWHAF
jgi:hypothetical protein